MAIAPVLAADLTITSLALLLGVLLIVIFLPRFLRKKPAAARAARPGVSAAESTRSRDMIDDMIVKLDDIGREIYAKIDTKIRILNRLIDDADDRIKKLQAASAAAPAPEPKARPAEPVPGKPANGPAAKPNGDKGRYTAVYALADAGQNVLSIARQTGMQPGEIELLLELRRAKNNNGSSK